MSLRYSLSSTFGGCWILFLIWLRLHMLTDKYKAKAEAAMVKVYPNVVGRNPLNTAYMDSPGGARVVEVMKQRGIGSARLYSACS